MVTARPRADAGRRQGIDLAPSPCDGALLGQHQREPAAERPLLWPGADSGFEQRNGLFEAALLPEKLCPLREEAVEREAAEGKASELERCVHALLRLGGTPFEEEARHPQPRGVPEVHRL